MELEDHSLQHPKLFNERVMIPATPSPVNLDQLDLQKELLDNYLLSKHFLVSVLRVGELDDNNQQVQPGDSPNQIAAVLNSARSSLAEIIKMRTELNNAERFKLMEQAMISVIRMLPEKEREIFVDKYEQIILSVTK